MTFYFGGVLLFLLATVLLLAVLTVWLVYNRLVQAKNRYRNAFAQISVQLKRRHDLIPNLTEAAKGYLKHESGTLESVIQARNQAAGCLQNARPDNPAALAQLAAAESGLAQALKGLNIQFEAYPELKASENMRHFSEELASTENRVSFARQAYNDSAAEYNTLRQVFPNNLVAALTGHTEDAALLEFDDPQALDTTPKVAF